MMKNRVAGWIAVGVVLLLSSESATAEAISILRSTLAGAIANGDGDDDLHQFYVDEGFSSSLFSGAVTSPQLSGSNLLVVMLPDDAFVASEITAMQGFLSSGGHLMFLGDQHSFASVQNGHINAALADLGSAMALGSTSVDSGFRNTVPGQLAAHPLNSTVGTLNYGNVNSISGVVPGNELLFASDLVTPWAGVESLHGGQVVLLADTNLLSNIENTAGNDNHVFFRNVANAAAVPEPATYSILLIGSLLIGGVQHRRQKTVTRRVSSSLSV